MQKVYVHKSNLITALGFSVEENFSALCDGKSGIRPIHFSKSIGTIYASKIEDQLLEEHFESLNIPKEYTRIEKLMIATLKPLIEKYGIKPNTLLIVSTTKGNIGALTQNNIEVAYLSVSAKNIQAYFRFQKTPIIVSNACVSGVMALSVAKRFIQIEQTTDAFVVAVDELTPFVISGFQSFQAMSNEVCQPYDENRKGVNLGEASAAVYVSNQKNEDGIEIIGEANINDANHISGPSRTGEGLYLSIEKALNEAQIVAKEIDFISAHGTATLYNDEMESIAFQRAHLLEVPMNSLKGYFGHTLGASGLLESIITWQCMKKNVYLPSFGFKTLGVSQPINIIQKVTEKPMQIALKTASGFGGSNSAMIFKK